MDVQASEYERQYNQLFSEVDGMGAAWQGADNVAFVTQIKGFMDDFQQMKGPYAAVFRVLEEQRRHLPQHAGGPDHPGQEPDQLMK